MVPQNEADSAAFDSDASNAADPVVGSVVADDSASLQESVTLSPGNQAGVLGCTEAIPVNDPQQVRELSPSILGAYQVSKGHQEFSGCTLDPRPFLGLRFSAVEDENLSADWKWFGGDGMPVSESLIRKLGFDSHQPCDARLRAGDTPMVERWRKIAVDQLASERLIENPSDGATQASSSEALLGQDPETVILWCRWASGTVAFRFDNGASARIPFAGWASDFVSKRQKPDPFRCPETGITGYELVALDSQTVTVSAAVGICQASQIATLISRLETCEISGKRVLPEFLSVCAISGRKAITDLLESCQWCQRQVVPSQISGHRCSDCREGEPIAGNDPLLVALLKKHPEWEKYGNWRGWRDAERAVLVGKSWRGGLAVICDPREQTVLRVAHRGPLRRQWTFDTP
ncbi:hypothetical protein FF011L_55480 [Roseimaritima multifibrata]|uniref:Uncharacterized protein n=1 Tax=Roseimaritima multifibrata TaxID=1930274 RepID=A0A517MPC1_9BACT|nr:hypothetical protein [Roseimaritima multifibrata]QDS96735.1 hypothetical protein FF011L_55480 [Roseimaritima multifibrata]